MIEVTRRDFIQNILKTTVALPLFTSGACKLLHDIDEKYLIVNELVKQSVISKSGQMMSDGFPIPGKPDGMTCVEAQNGNYILLRNHEILAGSDTNSVLPVESYDTKGPGGVTLIELDTNLKIVREQHALLGTSKNCSGGKTPWNTWLSCEETTDILNKRHGYVFEVDPYRPLIENAVPITHMGRFGHEACGVHEASGFVYMTEDEPDGCFYRYRPNTPGRLVDGGILEALKVEGSACSWIVLTDPDPADGTLRSAAHALGATPFVRGEGIAVNGDEIFFTSTTGGAYALGQIFVYNHDTETLELLFECRPGGLLRFPDNLTFNHFGDLIICEDSAGGSELLALTSEKKVYKIATSHSEWAGACLSPDNKFLFANIQETGETLAFEIPWEKIRRT